MILHIGIAAGYDNTPASVVKDSIVLISEPLTRIINLSIQSGIVPYRMKMARAIPIFKSGDNALLSNYRLVSVLLFF